ncbi:hypothetical protein GIB67_032602 [Kingdonia uniflora]|uniref:Uncharacterized protein n=1 Tax=Kingdonia uniflora TaxID=39325 RepID=A0A7J7LV41_9MAGN|nr:hypothetical protein GIB67_032602 [Kingdonia uniflora]
MSKFVVSEEGSDIGELKHLNNLRGKLEISNIKGVRKEASYEAILKDKEYLHHLSLGFRSTRFDLLEALNNDDDEAVQSVLEFLEPHPNLEVLKIEKYNGSKFPSWMEFPNWEGRSIMLRELTICSCKNLKVLPALGRLEFLVIIVTAIYQVYIYIYVIEKTYLKQLTWFEDCGKKKCIKSISQSNNKQMPTSLARKVPGIVTRSIQTPVVSSLIWFEEYGNQSTMADALISVVVEQLAPFLLDKLKKEVKLVLGAPEDVQELHDTFDKIRDVLDDAEKRHVKNVLLNLEKNEIKKVPESAWLEKLKDISYEMEDVLDEWHTKILKSEIAADESSTPDGVEGARVSKKKGCEELRRLPDDMGKMVSLRHFEGCWSLECFPRGIGKLKDLETLSYFVASEEGADIGELKHLNNLRGSLRISNIKGVVKEAILKDKEYLTHLILSFKINNDDDDDEAVTSEEGSEFGELKHLNNLRGDDDEAVQSVLELLEPHPILEELEIANYNGSKFPSWTEFPNWEGRSIRLCDLTIESCKNWKVDIDFMKIIILNFVTMFGSNDIKLLIFRGAFGTESDSPVSRGRLLRNPFDVNLLSSEELLEQKAIDNPVSRGRVPRNPFDVNLLTSGYLRACLRERRLASYIGFYSTGILEVLKPQA